MNSNNSRIALVTYEKKEEAVVVYNLLKDNENKLYSTRVQ